MKTLLRFAFLPLLILALPGCSTVYYGGMEKLGFEKRDILVGRVEKARDAQEATKEQFQSALEQFSTLVNYDGGELERVYDRLNSEFERSEAKANAVVERNDEVEEVAKALFREWQQELDLYTDASLRASSERQLADTKNRYQNLMYAMRRAEQNIDPVLKSFRNHVLYLKHNLNARAIGALQGELQSVEAKTENLIREMNRSIAEADAFIKTMGQ